MAVPTVTPVSARTGQRLSVARARDISRRIDGRGVLSSVDLDVHRGEVLVLLGRVGSGTSTLLRILACLDEGYTGELGLAGPPAVVFQDPRLLPWARVRSNVMLGHRGEQARGRAQQLLAEVGLDGLDRAWPGALTVGQAQRVALARALMGQPDLLLLDEPFGALDALTRRDLQRLLRTLCDRHQPGVLLVTHDVDEALLLADRILVLTDGVLSMDVSVDLPPRGRRDHPGFADLRRTLLAELGVVDDEAPR